MTIADTLKDTCPHKSQCLTQEECDSKPESAEDPTNPAFWGARLVKGPRRLESPHEEAALGVDRADEIDTRPTIVVTVEASGQWRVVARRSNMATNVLGFAGPSAENMRESVKRALSRAASLYGFKVVDL